MAHAKTEGNGWLEDAFRSLVQAQANLVQAQAAMSQAESTLIQNQASFVTQKAEIDKRIGEMERVNSDRFARIESLLLEHNRILTDHTQISPFQAWKGWRPARP